MNQEIKNGIGQSEKLLWNFNELKAALGIGKNVLYDLVKISGFPHITINGKYYFPVDKVRQWITQNTGKDIDL